MLNRFCVATTTLKKPPLWLGFSSRTSEIIVTHKKSGTPVLFSQNRCVQTWSKISRRDIAALEDRIWKEVGTSIQDPILQRDLCSLEWMDRRVILSDGDETLRVSLRVPTLLHPSLSDLQLKIRQSTEEAIKRWASEIGGLSFNFQVDLRTTVAKPLPMNARVAEDYEELISRVGPGLSNVAHFLAVYSCKGGVGKSTVAVNLAYELARMGGRVGLLDVDIYGPSLPIMVIPDDPAVRQSPLGNGMIYPIEHRGVKILSLGYVSPKSGVPGSGKNAGAAIMRGPMAGSVVSQLLKGTDWGDLDILILDLPPGTGDVQLSVCQDLHLSGAVGVTTPSMLSIEDTRKGIKMFTSLGVPTLAIVENMSYFMCNNCSSKHFPFGQGLQQEDNGRLGVDPSTSIIQLPISTSTSAANDSGSPICIDRPPEAADELAAFEALAKEVSKELLLLQYGQSKSTDQRFVTFEEAGTEKFDLESIQMSLDTGKQEPAFKVRLFSKSGATQTYIIAEELRIRDPKTGVKLQNDKIDGRELSNLNIDKAGRRRKPPTFIPSKVEKRGRYGYAVEWEDGSTVIYSMQCIATTAGGVLHK